MRLIENSCLICCSLLSSQYFCFLRFPIPFNICFKWFFFFLQRYGLAFLKVTGVVLLSIHFSNCLGLFYVLGVVQERCSQSILVKSLQISNVWHARMTQTGLETGEGKLELPFTCETARINKWMKKTVHSKHIPYSAKVNPKTQCCCIFNALAKFHLQISLIYSCRSRMASPQESLLSGS